MFVLCVINVVTGAFGMAMTVLPTLVLFQKLSPDHVEATMMALAGTVTNLS